MTMLPLLITFLLAGLVCALMLSLSRLFGPRRTTAVKSEPFECGMEQMEPPRRQFSVKFSVVAMLFIVFDIEGGGGGGGRFCTRGPSCSGASTSPGSSPCWCSWGC